MTSLRGGAHHEADIYGKMAKNMWTWEFGMKSGGEMRFGEETPVRTRHIFQKIKTQVWAFGTGLECGRSKYLVIWAFGPNNLSLANRGRGGEVGPPMPKVGEVER